MAVKKIKVCFCPFYYLSYFFQVQYKMKEKRESYKNISIYCPVYFVAENFDLLLQIDVVLLKSLYN